MAVRRAFMPKDKQQSPNIADEEILSLLRENPSSFLSGEEISRRLKVTRTAVWKKMNRLRSLGYEFEASTRSGYRLIKSPDLLIPSEVKPIPGVEWIGKVIHHFHALDSTNGTAYQLALEGAEEGEVVVAESQKKGRGRLGREWFSPPYLNLYLSVVLRPKLPPHQIPLITLMAAVAAAEAIHDFSGLLPSIKWPNDILIRERKVAGLLNEIQSEMDRIHFVILGIGVNLNMDVQMLPGEIQRKATSLRQEVGREVSRTAFLRTLLRELERWYAIFLAEGGEAILKAWRAWARITGRRVSVSSLGEILTGIAVDVDSDGALILQMDNGVTKRVVAGDVEYKR